ncbi:YaeQ family protein [Paraliomyxa miuraensis]|uniref:YaeQ family protein n=1 Tax=Paraliomyxa miuraensis TaxID=376150 RepID=UPI00224CA5A3|nr:YaeQ family protein [Paraliomyxa miuraensis]MCX4245956.1 YaeQ family protein [Paraliomyxa miuraensis]
MAQGSTVVGFEFQLSDVDRGIYQTLSFKVARHPSETAVYLVTRVLAYALEHAEGIELTPGLASADEPALVIRDASGRLRAWIEVGTPDAARLHRASKAADRVAVYCHKDAEAWLRGLAGHDVHRSETIALHRIDRDFVDALADRLARRNAWSLSITERTLYLDIEGTEGDSLFGTVERLTWPG